MADIFRQSLLLELCKTGIKRSQAIDDLRLAIQPELVTHILRPIGRHGLLHRVLFLRSRWQ